MPHVIRGLLACLLLLGISASGAASASAAASPAPPDTSSSPFVDRLDALVPDLLDRYNIPGAAVAVIRNGAVVAARGYGVGDAEHRRPMTAHTVVNTASISKAVAAWGVMRLVEDGRIALDAPVNRYLKRIAIESDSFDVRGVTVRRLLNHTSGLARGSYPGYAPGDDVPGTVAALRGDAPAPPGVQHDARLVHAPGSTMQYSGTGYAVLEVLIEDVTGTSFPDFMRTAVFEPLGLTRSAFGWPDSLQRHAATPHDMWRDTQPIRRFSADAFGNFNTTAADVGRWVAAVADGDAAPRGRHTLTPSTIDTMLTTGTASWGLGYEVETLPDGTELWGHSGWNLGWMGRFHVDPETGNGLAVLTNADPYGFMVTRGLHCAWVRETYDVSFERFCQPSAVALAAARFRDTTARAAIEQVDALRTASPDDDAPTPYVDETEFYVLGYRLLAAHRIHLALEVFRWNVRLHPDAWNAYDSLGEAYLRAGQQAEAVENYRRSLDLNPDNDHARRILDRISPSDASP